MSETPTHHPIKYEATGVDQVRGVGKKSTSTLIGRRKRTNRWKGENTSDEGHEEQQNGCALLFNRATDKHRVRGKNTWACETKITIEAKTALMSRG